NLPPQAWISYLSQKDNAVIVNGFAVDHEAIASFLSKLQRSSYFQNVKLVVSEQLVAPKNPLKKFTVTCDVLVGKL
ncbi:MAG: PilN domain-containing protein, partial [Deltaproteobacteria bacterium]|nr:PilN domain-containing protein [Deltaproteobacteria bacterium]